MRLDYAETNKSYIKGLAGLPSDYPVPSSESDMLFYIQRSQNFNTVIYQLNTTPDGFINESNPINVYWKNYESGGEIMNINLLQAKLAYGYAHKVINKHTVEINVVSYPSYRMMLTLVDGSYKILSKFNGRWEILTNIYVYVEDFGVFPSVKYVELYGQQQSTDLPCFERLSISE